MEGNVRKYTFKPSFTIRNRRDLLNILKEHQSKGLGGVLLEDVQESMINDEFKKIFDVLSIFCLNFDYCNSKSLVSTLGKFKKHTKIRVFLNHSQILNF